VAEAVLVLLHRAAQAAAVLVARQLITFQELLEQKTQEAAAVEHGQELAHSVVMEEAAS
jgi:hypothetical protein